MQPIQTISLGILIFSIILFRKPLGRYFYDGIKALYHEPFEMDQETEYQNIQRGLADCKNMELLEEFWNDIQRFQDEYKGVISEQYTSHLLSIYEEKEKQLSILN